MTSPKNNRSLLIAFGLVLAALSFAAVAWGADVAAPNLREERQREIAAKSEAERAPLAEKLQGLSRAASRRTRETPPVRSADLEEDARNGGNLRTVMEEYYNWLATLTPGQQKDLREIADPTRREIRVREILKEQQEQADSSDSGKRGQVSPEAGPEGPRRRPRGHRTGAPRKAPVVARRDQATCKTRRTWRIGCMSWDVAFRRAISGTARARLCGCRKTSWRPCSESISSTRLAAQVKQSQRPWSGGDASVPGHLWRDPCRV